jgi:hypothetical protein
LEVNNYRCNHFWRSGQKNSLSFWLPKGDFVGERGMIKSAQKEQLKEADFNFITALTRKQIETLEKDGVIDLGLFDEKLCEVEKDSQRYILPRNPCRADEVAATRGSKEAKIKEPVEKKTSILPATQEQKLR